MKKIETRLIKLNKKRCWQINKINQTKLKTSHDNVWGLLVFMRELFIAVMLNPSLKRRFTKEFRPAKLFYNMILAG